MSKKITSYGHRRQIQKAKSIIHEKFNESLSLKELSRECGLSSYYFLRLFSAYLGETPFKYLRRIRLRESLHMLEDLQKSVTDVSLEVGFDSASSYNKALKKELNMTPSEFRNLCKDKKSKLIKNISINKKMEEIMKNIKMNLEPKLVTREETTVLVYSQSGDDFKDVAPLVWERFLKNIENTKEDLSQSEFMGIGSVDEHKNCTYRAGVSLPEGRDFSIVGLEKQVMPKTKYAKFLLKGSYDQMWYAVDMAFKAVDENGYEFSKEPCIENYLNDPSVTPEEELLTEILIPIK